MLIWHNQRAGRGEEYTHVWGSSATRPWPRFLRGLSREVRSAFFPRFFYACRVHVVVFRNAVPTSVHGCRGHGFFCLLLNRFQGVRQQAPGKRLSLCYMYRYRWWFGVPMRSIQVFDANCLTIFCYCYCYYYSNE